MRKIILTILLLIFAQSLFGQVVNKEEYEVYAAVLREIGKYEIKYNAKLSFVILNKTMICETSEGAETSATSEDDSALQEITESKEFKEYWKKVKISKTDKDFEAKNKTSVDLQKLFPIKYQYWLAKEKEINDLIELGVKDFDKIQEERKRNKQPIYPEGDGSVIWKHFYQKYPNAGSYLEFSRVGFSSNKRFARVDVYSRGSGLFSQKWYVLKKIKKKWVIYTSWEIESIS